MPETGATEATVDKGSELGHPRSDETTPTCVPTSAAPASVATVARAVTHRQMPSGEVSIGADTTGCGGRQQHAARVLCADGGCSAVVFL